jgi:hypothetical protein
MKMKLFGITNKKKKEVDVSDLEKDVNAWMEQNPSIRIIDVRQSSNGGSMANTKVFISVWYEESV